MDDDSCAVQGHGAFERVTTANDLAVLDMAIEWHGAPLLILSCHESTLCANESSVREKGQGKGKRRLRKLGIRHNKVRAWNPQTNG